MTDLGGDTPTESQHPDVPIQSSFRLRNGILIGCLVTIVLVGLLVPMPFRGPAADPLADLAHAPLFCALALGALGALAVWWPSQAVTGAGKSGTVILRSMIVIAALTVFGIVIELLQRNVGRNASWGDVSANTLGAVAGTFAFWGLEWRRQSDRRWPALGLFFASVLLIVWASWGPAITLWRVMFGK
ncbi:MAG: hypothetical protein ACR2NZ_05340 [Rubripirellula sp.]